MSPESSPPPVSDIPERLRALGIVYGRSTDEIRDYLQSPESPLPTEEEAKELMSRLFQRYPSLFQWAVEKSAEHAFNVATGRVPLPEGQGKSVIKDEPFPMPMRRDPLSLELTPAHLSLLQLAGEKPQGYAALFQQTQEHFPKVAACIRALGELEYAGYLEILNPQARTDTPVGEIPWSITETGMAALLTDTPGYLRSALGFKSHGTRTGRLSHSGKIAPADPIEKQESPGIQREQESMESPETGKTLEGKNSMESTVASPPPFRWGDFVMVSPAGRTFLLSSVPKAIPREFARTESALRLPGRIVGVHCDGREVSVKFQRIAKPRRLRASFLRHA